MTGFATPSHSQFYFSAPAPDIQTLADVNHRSEADQHLSHVRTPALMERGKRGIWGFLASLHILRNEATKLYWLPQPSVNILVELSQGGRWSRERNSSLL